MSDTQYRLVVVIVAVAVFLGVARLRFGYELELPAKPPRPESSVATARALSENIARSSGAYDAYLQRDASAFGVSAAPDAEIMSAVFPYAQDREERTLEVGNDPVVVLGLRLSVTAERVPGARGKQLILQIENTTGDHLAYRVRTVAPRRRRSCFKKRDLRHNAVALAPHATVRRTECTLRSSNATLRITSVETVAVPELGYYYVSSVEADRFALDARTARSHEVPLERLACRMLLSVPMERRLESGAMTWRDLVDFYARHRCATYTIPLDYQAFQRDAEHPLPVVEESR